jgi:F-type H+-transporting ATPase subunit a
LNFGSLIKHFSFQNVILFFVGLLELVSEVAKVVSFAFRLFGNVFAGEVLLIVVASLVPFLAPLPFLFLELFVGLVQALVFALLTLVFLTIATAEHAHD